MQRPAEEELGRDRVLVVDDTPETLAMLTDALEAAGMTVLVSLDGQSAIERAQLVMPDIILMDAVMPGMDGFETCARIKQISSLDHIPVVFMTGLSDTEHVIRGFSAGGVDYVAKPIVPEQLVARVRAHLANARKVASAHDALDLAGRAVFSLDPGGRISWHTPSAGRLLEPLQSLDADRLPLDLTHRLLTESADETQRTRRAAPIELRRESATLSFQIIGRAHGGQLLVAVERSDPADQIVRLSAQFGLTHRECEVLLWIARGKSNRDIGDILELSPRTVNKHLERIYVKLGVENRAAAAAIATATLDRG